MNLFTFLNRGARHAPSDAERRQQAINDAAEATRAQWLNALLVDETRAWLDLGTRQPEILTAMTIMLTIAGFVHVHDTRDTDAPELRIIRGAISAAEQCGAAGCVVRAEDARAFSAAAQHATRIIRAGSVPAIIHAAETIRETVGMS